MDEVEKLKIMVEQHEKRISELESLVKSKYAHEDLTRKPIPPNIMKSVVLNLNNLKLGELSLIALNFYGKLGREEIIKILKKWGKKGSDSLSGGNFSRDLIKTGFITEAEKIGKVIVYELSEQGKMEADKLLNRLEKSETRGN